MEGIENEPVVEETKPLSMTRAAIAKRKSRFNQRLKDEADLPEEVRHGNRKKTIQEFWEKNWKGLSPDKRAEINQHIFNVNSYDEMMREVGNTIRDGKMCDDDVCYFKSVFKE